MVKRNADKRTKILHILLAVSIIMCIVTAVNFELCTNFVSAITKEGQLAKETTMEKRATIQNATGVKAVHNDDLLTEITQTKGDGVALAENADVYEGEYLKFSIKVTNQTEEDIEGVRLVAKIPEGVKYGELTSNFAEIRQPYFYTFNEEIREKEIEIGKIEAGQTKEVFYEVKANDLPEGEEEKTIVTNINTYVGQELAQEYEMTNVVKPSDVQLFLGSFVERGGRQYGLNIVSETQEEVEVKIHLPKLFKLNHVAYIPNATDNQNSNVKYIDYIDIGPGNNGSFVYRDSSMTENDEEYNGEVQNDIELEFAEDNTITAKLKTNSRYMFNGELNTEEIERKDENDVEESLSAYAEVLEQGNISNENRMEVILQNIEVSMTSSNENQKVKYKDEVNYEVLIKNIGGKITENLGAPDCVSVNIIDFLPEELNASTITYDTWEVTYEQETDENGNVINKTDENGNPIIRLEKKENQNIDIAEKHYDDNGNELANIDKYIIIPKGETAKIEIKTNAGMVYKETEISNSIIIEGEDIPKKVSNKVSHTILPYDYDESTGTTDPTDPTQPVDPEEPENPITPEEPENPNKPEEPETPVTPVTPEEPNNNNNNQTTKDICDFKVDKTISNVKVRTTSGVKEYNFNGEKLAKVEIPAKEISGAVVIVEYKIVVTNVGNVPGIVNKVADVLPDGLTFSSELNKEWNMATNGEIVNTKNTNVKINPGNSITLTLIATKQMRQNTTGTFNNQATISSASSISGLADSNAANNTSDAEIIISISTGVFVYIAIIIAVLAILVILGIIIVKKGKFNIKKFNKMTFTIIVLMMLIVPNIANAFEFSPTIYITDHTHCTHGGADLPGGNFSWAHSSPYGVAYCLDNSIISYSGTWSLVPGSVKVVSNKVTKEGNESNLELNKQNDIVGIERVYWRPEGYSEMQEFYSYGPLKYTAKNALSFGIYVKDADGNDLAGYHLFEKDEQGGRRHIGFEDINKEKGELYLYFEPEVAKKGISKIELAVSGFNYKTQQTVTTYSARYTNNGQQPYVVYTTETGEEPQQTHAVRSVTWDQVNTYLDIRKVDKDTKEPLTYVTFRIKDKDGKYIIVNGLKVSRPTDGRTEVKSMETTTDVNQATIFATAMTSSDIGEIHLWGMPKGKYTIEEVSNSNDGYTKMEIREVIVKSGQLFEYDIENEKQTGNLKIRKINASTGQPMAGVKFTVSYMTPPVNEGGNYTPRYIQVTEGGKAKKEVTGKITLSEKFNEVSYLDVATEFITDENGEIQINNLPVGKYMVREMSVTEDDKKYFDVDNDYIFWEVNGKEVNGNTAAVEVDVKRQSSIDTGNIESDKVDLVVAKNRQKYVDLSGFVWEDVIDGKSSIRNGKYNTPEENTADENDKLLQGVTVNLKTIDKNEIKGTATTDSEGKYKFEKVEIDSLSNLYIEFVYNGMSYQNVVTSPEGLTYGNANTSKAIEGPARQEFNNKFQTITNNKANGSAGDITLSYDRNTTEHTSTLNFGGNPVYGYEGARFPINGVAEQYLITANTKNAYNGGIDKYKSPDSIRTEGIKEVEYLNLGLYEREQPTLSVKKDIDSVKLAINGFNHIYKYGSRFDNAEYGYENGFNVGVKFGEKYGNMSYSRAVYKSDYDYTNTTENSRELQANITYRIELANRSTNLKAQVNSIVDYYDARYPSNIVVGTTLNKDGSISNTIPYKEIAVNNRYKGLDIDTSTLGGINPQSAVSIYVQFTMSGEQLNNIIKVNEQDTKAPLDNIAEISSYSILNGDYVYAGIDNLSNPGNCVPGDTSTYEMDTDKAPAMTLEVQDKSLRKIEGSVFEDKELAEKLEKENIRQGDGIYGNGEKGIAGVTVTLYTEDANANIKEMTTTTDANGNYYFEGFIPGHYKIKFTWGDETYTVQDYKGTIFNKEAHNGVEFNGQLDKTKWYKQEDPRHSDAIDDYGIRQAIDKELEIIRHDTNAKVTIDKMDSYTPEFTMELENPRDENGNNLLLTVTDKDELVQSYEAKNIDFGIIKRPIQQVELTKRVTHVKLTLANGQIIIDTGISEDGNTTGLSTAMVVLPPDTTGNGTVKIEMDSELIQGSVLEVTYGIKATNNSELDYANEEFYKYGVVPNTDPVSITNVKVVDYLDKDWSVDSANTQGWKIISEEDKEFTDNVSKEVSDESQEIKDRTILTTEIIGNNKTLKPGESETVELETIKTLTTANSQDIELDNDAEIIEIKKTGGGKVKDITPGNYVPEKGPYELDDDKAETVIITPNTGDNFNYILPISIAIGALAIIAVGIVVIKKKAIGKEE